MRVSTYEVVLPLIGAGERPVAGKRLLVNGLYQAIDVVDANVAERLLEGSPEKIPVDARERLASRGHITRKSPEEEEGDLRLLGRIYGKTAAKAKVGLVLLPTYDCNFRCPYCFEQHRLSRGQEWLCRRMQPQMVEAVFEALRKLRERGCRAQTLTLYGGEPLMRENKPIVREICEHARHMGLTLDAITNGYDLDGYLDLIEEFAFERLQVTVDGVGALNDRRRLHRDGVATYGRIMENVALALERGVDVHLRVNVNRDNIGGIADLMRDLSDRGLTRPNQDGRGKFSYYFKAVSEDPDSPTHVTEREVLDAIVAAGIEPYEALKLQSQYAFVLNDLNELATKNRFPLFRTAYCGAESGALVVDPEGKIHTCWDLVGMDAESVGQVDVNSKELVYNFTKAKWRLRTSDRMERCRRCPYALFCRGGCASVAGREHGSYFREHCGEFEDIFSYTASRACGRRWEESGEDELSISLHGPLSRMTQEEREELMTTPSGSRVLKIWSQLES